MPKKQEPISPEHAARRFFEMPSLPVRTNVSMENIPDYLPDYPLNEWIPLHIDDSHVIRVPEMCTVLFKTDGINKCFHLGVVLDGNFYEHESRNRSLKRRHDFSFWNAWGKGFGDSFYSPTHVMILENP